MKTLLIIVTCLLFSCSEDPGPQKPCEQLKVELSAAQDAILDHQAKGSNGNPDAWKAELNRLITTRDKIQAEYTKRHCL